MPLYSNAKAVGRKGVLRRYRCEVRVSGEWEDRRFYRSQWSIVNSERKMVFTRYRKFLRELMIGQTGFPNIRKFVKREAFKDFTIHYSQLITHNTPFNPMSE
jgi:hypothetical protein